MWFRKETCECKCYYDIFYMMLLLIIPTFIVIMRKYRIVRSSANATKIRTKCLEIMDLCTEIKEYEHIKVCNLLKDVYELAVTPQIVY